MRVALSGVHLPSSAAIYSAYISDDVVGCVTAATPLSVAYRPSALPFSSAMTVGSPFLTEYKVLPAATA